ncbi:hypothetical protein EVAR_3970_1 [Eumeta japonica]|uniref:Uncharacterized protein n=1 Tax=Eumeta variegata TaxID=151549 RepID=A0A4C1SRM0_EUMVA|nr:hypothetical protein EVAR_3970_1 [Eumeta japonica]
MTMTQGKRVVNPECGAAQTSLNAFPIYVQIENFPLSLALTTLSTGVSGAASPRRAGAGSRSRRPSLTDERVMGEYVSAVGLNPNVRPAYARRAPPRRRHLSFNIPALGARKLRTNRYGGEQIHFAKISAECSGFLFDFERSLFALRRQNDERIFLLKQRLLRLARGWDRGLCGRRPRGAFVYDDCTARCRPRTRPRKPNSSARAKASRGTAEASRPQIRASQCGLRERLK